MGGPAHVECIAVYVQKPSCDWHGHSQPGNAGVLARRQQPHTRRTLSISVALTSCTRITPLYRCCTGLGPTHRMSTAASRGLMRTTRAVTVSPTRGTTGSTPLRTTSTRGRCSASAWPAGRTRLIPTSVAQMKVSFTQVPVPASYSACDERASAAVGGGDRTAVQKRAPIHALQMQVVNGVPFATTRSVARLKLTDDAKRSPGVTISVIRQPDQLSVCGEGVRRPN
jgi:hypothetical protein